MIVYAGIIAHNPALLQDKKISGSITGDAVHTLSSSIAATRVTTLVIISEHARTFEKKCTLQFATEFSPALKRFGIINKANNYAASVPLIEALRQFAQHHKLALQHVASAELDYGSAAALKLLDTELSHLRIVVLGTSDASIIDHAELGYRLKDILQNSTERIGILVSGDASHKHTSDSPAGFSAHAVPFDQDLLHTLETRSIAGLTRLAKNSIETAECLLRPLALAFGMLRRFPAATKIISYEVRHGVGLINANLFIE